MSDTIELRLLNEQLILIRATLIVLSKPGCAFSAVVSDLHAQAEVFRAANVPPAARVSTLDRCEGVSEEKCGLLDADSRIPRGSFTNPNAWQCLGCGYQEQGNYASQ